MGKQTNLFDVHRHENNEESQKNLDKNRKKFSQKCQIVYDRLMAGEILTVLGAANDGISALPRRCLDLKQKGVEISDYWHQGIKYYHMTSSQVETNERKFKNEIT